MRANPSYTIRFAKLPVAFRATKNFLCTRFRGSTGKFIATVLASYYLIVHVWHYNTMR